MSERPPDRMLRELRRDRLLAVGSLICVAVLAVCVGRHPGAPGTVTSLPAVGRFDGGVYDWVQTLRTTWLNGPLEAVSRLLNIVGGGLVMTPVRIAIAAWLLWKRLWAKAIAFAAIAATSELLMTVLKRLLDRARPLDPLVHTSGASFPSGHTVATASTAVAFVLTVIASGPARRAWMWAAGLFIVAMAISRVYLNAHWFSDVLAGSLLGAGVATAGVAFADRFTSRRPAGADGSADDP